MAKLILEGSVEGVYIVPPAEPTLASSPVPEIQVTLEGFTGDRHAGFTLQSDSRTPFYPRGTQIRNSRQVSLVSAEELEEVARSLGVALVQAEWLGANLLLRGIPQLTQLPPGTRIFFPGDTVLWVTGENHPCLGPGKLIQAQYPSEANLASRFVRDAMGKRGLVACVERAGSIHMGDQAKVELSNGK
ncbi:MAG: hypothetical protein PHQ40_21535 [Anaerolineaceae bacterium]|nr:hypothetical protein [Anaerolineaceae bacterium]